MQPPPLVSVIIPTYNRAALLAECVASALAQDYPRLEVLVVDDGSIDDTRTVIAKIDDPRLSYHWQPNAGAAAARNYGLRLAQGTLAAFLDSDDLFLPDKLSMQVAYLETHADVILVGTWYEELTATGARVITRAKPPPQQFSQALIEFMDCAIATPSVMVRREAALAVGGFDEALHLTEDLEFYLRLSKFGQIAVLKEVLTVVRRQANSLTSKIDRQLAFKCMSRAVHKAIEASPELGAVARKHALARVYLQAWAISCNDGGAPDWSALAGAFRRWPLDSRLWLSLFLAVRHRVLKALLPTSWYHALRDAWSRVSFSSLAI